MNFMSAHPAAMIEGGKTFSWKRAPAYRKKTQHETRLIRSFKDLPSAAEAFDAALAKITA